MSISAGDFTKRHPKIGTIGAATFPTTTDFTEWVVWADGKMKSYLQCGDTLPTDVGGILKNVADDLLFRKYLFEKIASTNNPLQASSVSISDNIVELTVENKKDLDQLKGQATTETDPCAFNFDLDTLEGGFED